jgi:Uma2 family endonuclease
MSTATLEPIVHYPSSDGEPMGETGIHVRTIMMLLLAVDEFFRDQPDVYCAADMFWYWEKGNPAACTAPDVMVIPGVGKHERDSFKSWEEGGAFPAVVFEIASENTWKNDIEDKYDTFEELGVKEYFIFDPEGDYLRPRLQGYRLRKGAYHRVASKGDMLASQLGFSMRGEGTMLRLIDTTTGRPIPTPWEAVELETRRAEEKARLLKEQTRRADELAAENARLLGLLKIQQESNGNGS